MIVGLILMLVRYLVSAVILVTAKAITVILSPILALLSFTTTDGNLPRCCYWLQTHDNPLDGLWVGDEGYWHRIRDYNDYTWLFKHSNEVIAASFWLKYLARIAWLVRNPAYGVADALGVDFDQDTQELKYMIGSHYEFLLFKTKGGQYGFRFQLVAVWLFGKVLKMDLGWKPIGNEKRWILAVHINPFRKA